MSTQPVEQLHFGFYPQRDLLVQRHEGQITSDAGLIPLHMQRGSSEHRMDELKNGLHADRGAGEPVWSLWLSADHGLVAGGELDVESQAGRATLATRRIEGAAEAAQTREIAIPCQVGPSSKGRVIAIPQVGDLHHRHTRAT